MVTGSSEVGRTRSSSRSAGGTPFNYNFANFDGNTQDSTYRFSISGTTGTGTTLVLSFSGATKEALNNEFYGLDDVSVVGTATGVSAVPMPAAAPMFGAALIALGALGYGLKRRNAAV